MADFDSEHEMRFERVANGSGKENESTVEETSDSADPSTREPAPSSEGEKKSSESGE